MKKLYTLAMLLLISTMSFAQIGYSWWMFLPLDYEENPYPRQTVQVQKVTDEFATSQNSLDDLWNTVPEELTFPIEGWINQTADDWSSGEEVTVDVPAQTPEDFTAHYTMMSGDQNLYVLYNVVDDEVSPMVGDGDFVELAFAPYAGQYDPGREIYPDMSRTTGAGYWWAEESSHVWGWNASAGEPQPWGTVIPGDVYVDMSLYGTWTEAGAYKCDLPLATSAEVFAAAPTYTMKGPNLDTLGDVAGGLTASALQTLYEPKSDGYYFLVVIPWSSMSAKLENIGDQMSIAPKVNDWDSDNFTVEDSDGNPVIHRYDVWGSTDNNGAYWAIAYYGAVAELVESTSTYEAVNNAFEAFYSSSSLTVVNGNGKQTVDIYNVNGVLVRTFQGQATMDLSFLNAGFYVADIHDDEGNRSLVKFVKSVH